MRRFETLNRLTLPLRGHPLWPYLLAVLAVALGTTLRFLLAPILHSTFPYFPFYISTMLACYYGGLRGGLFASILGFIVSSTLFVPWFQGGAPNSVNVVGAISYLAVSASILVLVSAVRRAELRERARADEELKMQNALRASEEQLRTTLDSIGDGLIVLDSEWRFTFVNAAAESMVGLSRKEMLGRSQWELYPETIGSVVEKEYRLAAAGQARDFEYLYPPWQRWFHLRCFPRPSGGISVYFEEITEWKRNKEAVIQSERLYRAIGESIDYGIWICDPTGRNTYASDSLLRLLGITQEQCSDFGWGDTLHPDDAEETLAAWKRCVAEGGNWYREHRFRGVDGKWHPILACGVPVRDANGTLTCFAGINLDISRLRDAERALRENEERFRLAAQATRSMVYDCDLGTMKVGAMNGVVELIGTAPAELAIEWWIERILPEDRGIFTSALDEMRVLRKDHRIEYRVKHHDGRLITVADQATTIVDRSSGALRMVGTIVDITAQKAAERNLLNLASERERLLESERIARMAAEKATRVKDEFLATISHELRTPLNAVLGWAKLIRKKPQDLDRGLEIIERNAKLQGRLIEDLLDMNRIVSGKFDIEVEEISLTEILQHAVESVQTSAADKSIRTTVTIDTLTAPQRGDPSRLQQVFSNILVNSVKFTPPGGEITVRLSQDDSAFRITITDTGEGIDPDFIPQLFGRFSQGEVSISKRKQGLGLGLAVAKHIVDLHNGSITAYSKGKDQGSTFTVSLPVPAACSPLSTHSSEWSLDRFSRGMLVLLTEDDPDSREFLRSALEEHGAVVDATATAVEALERLNHITPTIILSDIGLPGVDGYTYIRQVRARTDSARAIPAIAVTAFIREEDKRAALDAGFSAFVSKPIDLNDLFRLMNELQSRAGNLQRETHPAVAA